MNVAIVYGGKSPEHDISVITALQCQEALKCLNYNITKIYITKENKWYLADKLSYKENYIDKSKFAKTLKNVSLIDGRIYIKNGKVFKFYKDIDCIINCCHGGSGENGELYAILNNNNIKISSSDMLSSAICMNKWLTKQILKEDIPTVKAVRISKSEFENNFEEILPVIKDTIGDYVIAKPNHLGSSIGIEKTNPDNLKNVLQAIFKMDTVALVEEIVPNLKEVNCAVIKDGDKIILSELESPVKNDDILSFKDKYMSAFKSKGMKGASRQIPADISDEMYRKIVKYSLLAYDKLNLNGVVRIDYLIDEKKGDVFLNEVNTVPGSLAFYLFEPVGIDYPRLLQILINNAKTTTEPEITYFDSDVLKM